MNPLDVECIHSGCDAQKGEACSEFNIEDPKHPEPYLIAGAPAYHGERYASLAMDQGLSSDAVIVDKAIIDRAAEDLID
jgi:hypothetical protein